MDVEARLDTSFRCTRYMTSPLFLGWLESFDLDMVGRRMVLLMDNAPGHGKEAEVEERLQNICII